MPAEGFKVVTVHKKTYEEIKELAKLENCTVPKFIDNLVLKYKRPIPPPPLFDEPVKPKETRWDWPGPYISAVTAPRVEYYRSTAWILTEDYPDTVGRPQWDPAILERVMRAHQGKEKFKVEKILIISPDAWNKKRVWDWVSEWYVMDFAYGNAAKVFVISQDDLEGKKKNALECKDIDKKYYDMGIYDDEMVAFLTLNKDYATKPRGIRFYWDFDPDDISEAKKVFEKIKTCALTRAEVMQRLVSQWI